MEAPSPGTLLIADPFLKDPNFVRSVILLCEHQEEGSFGFVLNKHYPHRLEELIPELAGFDYPVFQGGPVQQDSLYFLHQYPNELPGGFEVSPGVFWGGEFDRLIEMIHANEIDSSRIRFFLGYSGWTNGQLDGEIKEHSWLTVKATQKLIFLDDIDQIWKESLRLLGGEYEMMINFPIDPQLN